MDDAPTPLPHARFQHVFVIVRVDRYERPDGVKETIKVKKVVLNQRHAQLEVDRLNALNRDKQCEYYWEVAQLDPTGNAEHEIEQGTSTN